MAEQTQNGPMVRSQLLITPALRQRLERVAEREGRSLSDVARRAMEVGLDALEDTGEARIQQRLALLQELAEIRRRDRERNGVYEGDLIAEVRAERERQMERVWRGE
jgi:predicted DNA-binding protein